MFWCADDTLTSSDDIVVYVPYTIYITLYVLCFESYYNNLNFLIRGWFDIG